jgi:hypothetical protein
MESSVLSGINNYELMKSSDFLLWAQIVPLVSKRMFFDDGMVKVVDHSMIPWTCVDGFSREKRKRKREPWRDEMNNFATKVNKVIPNLLKVNLRKASMQAASSTSTASSQGKGPLVAVAQLTATNDHAKNFSEAAQCAQQAADKGCSLLALPECFSFIGSSPQETLAQVGGLRPLFFFS